MSTPRHARRAAIFVVGMLFAASAAAGAPTGGVYSPAGVRIDGPDMSQWRHVANVEMSAAPTKGLVELALPPEVFALSRADLGDLRLTTQDGQWFPYVLRVDMGKPGSPAPYRPARTFNPVFVPGQQSQITVEFGNTAERTRLDVDTPGTNFRRRVMIEASQDGQSWQVLCQTAWLFRIAYDTGTYSKKEITLPQNDFRFLRITVFNAPDDPEQIAIRDVTAWYDKHIPPKTVEAPARSTTVDQNPKLKATDIAVDLGYENLPWYEVEMAIEDSKFLRRVEVFGRNCLTRTIVEAVEDGKPRKREIEEPWEPRAGGTVHRFPAGAGEAPSANLSLPVAGQCRYLLVRIYNGDDAPLKCAGLKVLRLQEYLGFSPNRPGPYRLYTGNPDAQRPRYDLEHFADTLRKQALTEARLGPLTPNPLFAVEAKALPWSERHKWLLWGALAVVLAGLGVLVWRQAKGARPVT